MRSSQGAFIAFIIMELLCFGILISHVDELIWDMLAALIACGMFVVYVIKDRAVQARKAERRISSNQLTFLRTLNHHRHDWMNEVQVLMGYIRLKKYDNLMGYVDKIKDRMLQESQISRLGVPSLILFLQSYRTMSATMELEVEAAEEHLDLSKLSLPVEPLTQFMVDIIQWFKVNTKPTEEDVHRLHIKLLCDEQQLIMEYHFTGEYQMHYLASAMNERVSEAVKQLSVTCTQEHEQGKAHVKLMMPLHK